MITRLCVILALVVAQSVFAAAQDIPLDELPFAKKLKLAKAGDDLAQLAVAMHYELGVDAQPDFQQAARWYREATLKGNIDARYRLARLIGKGAPGLNKDKAAAIKLLQSAAELGHAPSQNELGLRLQNGDGITADPTLAAEWYKKAANQKLAAAEVNLGLLHVRGEGVTKDIALAFKLFSQAAEQGDSWALNNLGSMHEMGWGTPKNIDKAKDYYRLAIAKGNALAQANLARLETQTTAPAPAATVPAN